MSSTLQIELSGEQMLLHPDKALLWPARKTVLIADAHFGKDDVFRRAGIALPRGPAITDLQRLTALVDAHRYERLVVLGRLPACADSRIRQLPARLRDLAIRACATEHRRRGWKP